MTTPEGLPSSRPAAPLRAGQERSKLSSAVVGPSSAADEPGWNWWGPAPSTSDQPSNLQQVDHEQPPSDEDLGAAWSWWSDEEDQRPRRALFGIEFRLLFSRFAPYLLRRRGWVILLLVLALLPPAAEAAEIWLFKIVVDNVLIPRDFGLFPVVAAAYVGLTLVGSAITSIQLMLSTWLSQRFLVELRMDLLRHLQRLSLDFFSRSKIGDLLSRMTSDVAAIEEFVLSATTGFVTATLQLVFFVSALFYLQWQLALVALVVMPAFGFISRRVARRLKDLSRERQQLNGQIGSVVEEGLSNVALVQAYGQEERQLRRFRLVVERKNFVEMGAARLKAIYEPMAEMTELVGMLLVIGTGTWLVTRGEISVGGLLAFLTFLTSLFGPVRQLGGVVNAAFSASAGAERVVELLDESAPVTDLSTRDIGRAQRLEVQGVGFSYPGAPAPSLDNASFWVGPGETVALVGASGAGKSTMAKMLLRFYDPDSGRILLNGCDVRSISLYSLRRNISVLLQETLVFDGSIRDNISYGRSEATPEEVVEAARAADADDFIMSLADGYDTRVGERGRRLSGGQCQRIAIARAMLRDAPFLLLDEPTNGLDATTVDNVIEPLRRLMAGRSTIIISHNLLTVRDATRIVVLDRGRVVEVGRHEHLLGLNGHYARLWRQSGLMEAADEADPAGADGSSEPPGAVAVRRTARADVARAS